MGNSKYGYLKDLPCSPKQQKVLDYIIEHKGEKLSADQIAKGVGYSESNFITPTLKKFLRLGFLRKEGANKKTKYINEND